MFQEADDEVGEGVDHYEDGEVDSLERMGVGEEGSTLLNWPGCSRLREETALQPEIRLDLITGRNSPGE